MTNKILIPAAIVIAALILGGAFVYTSKCKQAGEFLSAQEAGEKAIAYINEKLLSEETTASLVNAVEQGNIYKITLKIGETEYDSYVTKDGEFLFPEGYELNEKAVEEQRDIPDIKLFVMSYCPFGLQAEKMFLPVYELLKGKADMGIYFVDYIMHGKDEIDENINQYCVQKEAKDQFADYLNCFVLSGDSDSCLAQVGINKGMIENCYFETDKEFGITTKYNHQETWLKDSGGNAAYPVFEVHKDLNEQYGVQGSPTIVINDKIVNVSSRSPESFKQVVCQAFAAPPEECSQVLSEDVPASGIGGGTGSGSGTCQ